MYNVTYFMSGETFTEEMSEGQLKNMERRIEEGRAEESILHIEEVPGN